MKYVQKVVLVPIERYNRLTQSSQIKAGNQTDTSFFKNGDQKCESNNGSECDDHISSANIASVKHPDNTLIPDREIEDTSRSIHADLVQLNQRHKYFQNQKQNLNKDLLENKSSQNLGSDGERFQLQHVSKFTDDTNDVEYPIGTSTHSHQSPSEDDGFNIADFVRYLKKCENDEDHSEDGYDRTKAPDSVTEVKSGDHEEINDIGETYLSQPHYDIKCNQKNNQEELTSQTQGKCTDILAAKQNKRKKEPYFNFEKRFRNWIEL